MMKKYITLFLCTTLLALILTGCTASQRTNITSTTIQNSMLKHGTTIGTYEGQAIARVDFTVYNFGTTPSVDDLSDAIQVTTWFLQYADFYQNDQERNRILANYSLDEFKEGKECAISVFYLIIDDGTYSDLSFSFDLEGFETSYSDDFTYNTEWD